MGPYHVHWSWRRLCRYIHIASGTTPLRKAKATQKQIEGKSKGEAKAKQKRSKSNAKAKQKRTLSALFPNLGFLEQDVHDALREIKGAQVHTFPSFIISHRGGSSYSQEVYKVTLPAILDVISAKMAAASCAKGPSYDIFEPSWTILGLCWSKFGAILAHLGPTCLILAETLFVYERSEGLPDNLMII